MGKCWKQGIDSPWATPNIASFGIVTDHNPQKLPSDTAIQFVNVSMLPNTLFSSFYII